MCVEYLLRGGQVASAQMNNSCVPWLFYGRRMQSILGAVIRRCNIYDIVLASTQMCPLNGTQVSQWWAYAVVVVTCHITHSPLFLITSRRRINGKTCKLSNLLYSKLKHVMSNQKLSKSQSCSFPYLKSARFIY